MTKQLSAEQIRAIKAKENSQVWSAKLPFDRNVIKLLKNNEGNYELFDKNGKMLYVGSSTEIKHRVESYRELDSAKEHPTKVPLRQEIAFFRFRYVPLSEAEIHERNIKNSQRLPFNMDNKFHEEIKKEKKHG